jgi:steroid delta-isomerase
MQHHSVIYPEVEAGVQRLVQLYEQLTPERLNSLHTCYAPHAHFKDPFNDVRGLESIRKVFAHMFTTVDAPRFVVTEQLVQGQQAFLAWEFHFRMRRWRKGVPQCIRGGTLLQLNAQGLVLEHRDYWDTAEELYEKLPLLGRCMAWLRRAGSATASSKP